MARIVRERYKYIIISRSRNTVIVNETDTTEIPWYLNGGAVRSSLSCNVFYVFFSFFFIHSLFSRRRKYLLGRARKLSFRVTLYSTHTHTQNIIIVIIKACTEMHLCLCICISIRKINVDIIIAPGLDENPSVRQIRILVILFILYFI